MTGACHANKIAAACYTSEHQRHRQLTRCLLLGSVTFAVRGWHDINTRHQNDAARPHNVERVNTLIFFVVPNLMDLEP